MLGALRRTDVVGAGECEFILQLLLLYPAFGGGARFGSGPSHFSNCSILLPAGATSAGKYGLHHPEYLSNLGLSARVINWRCQRSLCRFLAALRAVHYHLNRE